MQIGPYHVQTELGRGGMGVVYRVLAPDGQAYALKRLHTESNTDDQLRLRRIERELQALKRITHPGVVRAVDSGYSGGAFYIVMELITGESLGDHLQRQGPLQPELAASYCATLGRTLHELHLQGIVHRDVKPDNVLLDEGRPRLTDLGLVRLYDGEERLTQTGTAIGTPGYCAPELLAKSGEDEPGAGVDVFGLGATLYALLTGRAPFEGNTHYEIAVQTVEATPRAPSMHFKGSAEAKRIARLDEICLRCLAKDPTDRYRTTLSVAEALEGTLENSPKSSKTSLPDGFAILVSLVLVVLLLGTAYVFLAPRDFPGSSPEASLAKASSPEPSPPPAVSPTASLDPRPPRPSPRLPTPRPSRPPPVRPSPPPNSDWPLSSPLRLVTKPEHLSPLGVLASTIWKGRNGDWALGRTPEGFVTVRSTLRAKGSTVRYFFVERRVPSEVIKASVTVECDDPASPVMAGLLYGRTDLKTYFLLGLTERGQRFVKLRTPKGLQDRLANRAGPGPHSFGVEETPQGLSISLDGKRRMLLGKGSGPKARIGVFVIGDGVVKFKDFKLKLE